MEDFHDKLKVAVLETIGEEAELEAGADTCRALATDALLGINGCSSCSEVEMHMFTSRLGRPSWQGHFNGRRLWRFSFEICT